jgi:hypothetical protein
MADRNEELKMDLKLCEYLRSYWYDQLQALVNSIYINIYIVTCLTEGRRY